MYTSEQGSEGRRRYTSEFLLIALEPVCKFVMVFRGLDVENDWLAGFDSLGSDGFL